MSEILYDFGQNSVVPANMVEEDGGYTLFPEGRYHFTVIGFKRIKKDTDVGKIPRGAWGAEMTFLLQDEDGRTTTVKKVFWLVQSCSWIAGKLLRAVGLRKSKDPIEFALLETCKQNAMTGLLDLKHRQGTGKYADKIYNEINDFIDPENGAPAAEAITEIPEEELF